MCPHPAIMHHDRTTYLLSLKVSAPQRNTGKPLSLCKCRGSGMQPRDIQSLPWPHPRTLRQPLDIHSLKLLLVLLKKASEVHDSLRPTLDHSPREFIADHFDGSHKNLRPLDDLQALILTDTLS